MSEPAPAQPGAAATMAALLSYPVLAHAAIVTGSDRLAVVSVAWLCTLALLVPLRRGRWWAWVAWACALVALWRLGALGLGELPMFLPPVLIAASVCAVFASSLLPGRTPLVEQFARAMTDSPLDGERRRYARSVTGAWAWLTGMLALANLTLGLLATPGGLLEALGVRPGWAVPLATWSLFANVLNYAILGAMFLAEYAWRRRRFSDEDHGSFIGFVRAVSRLRPGRTQRPPRA